MKIVEDRLQSLQSWFGCLDRLSARIFSLPGRCSAVSSIFWYKQCACGRLMVIVLESIVIPKNPIF